MEFYEFLDLVQANGLVVTLVSLLAYVICVGKRDGFVIVVGASCFLTLCHFVYDAWVMGLSDGDTDQQLVLILWYLGFAASDFIFVFAAYALLDNFQIPVSKASSFFLNCLLVRGFIQLARYFDRVLVETDYLGYLYSLTIPLVNTGMVLFALATAVLSFVVMSRRKENA